MEGYFLCPLGMRDTSGVTLEVHSNGDRGSTQSGKLCHCLDQGEGLGALVTEAGGVHVAGSCWGKDTPEGMLSRADIGPFPSKRWKRVTIIPWALGGLVLRAVLQVARKVRQSLISSPVVLASRCWMSLSCDYWISWACEAPWDSASLIAVEQWFSASAKAWAQSASASLMQVAYQISASLISPMQWVSASLMVWEQRTFTVFMASVTSDSFWWRAIPNSETSFLWQSSKVDLIPLPCWPSLEVGSHLRQSVPAELWSTIRMRRRGIDLLQGGIVYVHVIWNAHLRGGIYQLGGVLQFKR